MNTRTSPPKSTAGGENLSVDIQLLSQLFDQATDTAFFVKDAQGRYLAVNDSLVTRHGWKKKGDVLGKRSAEICAGDFGAVPSRQDDQVLRTGRPLIDQLEMQWHRPQQATWCLTTKLPIRDAQGQIIGLIGFSRDMRTLVEPSEIPVEFAQAIDEFEQTLSAEVNPAWFAKRSKLSPGRLSRLTKRIFDLTPGQMITKIRIAAATKLLQSTDMSVADIAHRCGFYDHSAFTRTFRNATGTTPSKFRQALP